MLHRPLQAAVLLDLRAGLPGSNPGFTIDKLCDLGKFLDLSVPPAPRPENGDDGRATGIRLYRELNYSPCIKGLAHGERCFTVVCSVGYNLGKVG